MRATSPSRTSRPSCAGSRLGPEFFAVSAGLETVGRDRPFYPARGVRGMTRAAHAAALGMDGPLGLSRWCDRATAERPAGAPLFWTLGANQSGKAAIAAWRDWLLPALGAGLAVAFWPFEGGLHALLAPGRAVLAEVYPAEALRQCGLRLSGSKRVQAPRRGLAGEFRAAMEARRVLPSPALAAAIADGFGSGPAGEDRFDSAVGLLGLSACSTARGPTSCRTIPGCGAGKDGCWARRRCRAETADGPQGAAFGRAARRPDQP